MGRTGSDAGHDLMARDGFALVLFVAASIVAAVVGGIATSRSVTEWYPTITKPAWTPDPSVIGLAWTVLYPAIGVAGWLIWRAGGQGRSVAVPLAMWAVQLALNAAWSWAFFGARSAGLGVLVIVLLWLSILAVIVTAWEPARVAGVLFVPYLAWVSFAGALTVAIWRLNA